jgi:hypothetical protein
MGSFLRSAATTAAGVAAGALAFEGIRSMLGGFGHESLHSGFLDNASGESILHNYEPNPIPDLPEGLAPDEEEYTSDALDEEDYSASDDDEMV